MAIASERSFVSSNDADADDDDDDGVVERRKLCFVAALVSSSLIFHL
jgi:hypothetical protein